MLIKIAHIGITEAEIDIPDRCPKCTQWTNSPMGRRMPLLLRTLPESQYNRVYDQIFVVKGDLIKYTKGIFQIICGDRLCNHIFYSAFGEGSGAVATDEELKKLKALLEL